jgi:hypothetical protein
MGEKPRNHSSPTAHPKASAPSAVAHSRHLLRVSKWGHGCRSWTPAAVGGRVCARAGAEVMPPLWQYLSRTKEEKADESIPAPKGRESWPLSGYSCKSVVFRVPQWGAMTSVMAPPTTPSALPRFGPEGGCDWWPKAMPRCGSTSRGWERRTSGWLPPKGENHGPLGRSSLQISRFLGVRNGGHDAGHGPSGRAPLVGRSRQPPP